ncbi:hypothetical protein COCVIDRAFT_86011 [Bipolaris victoriae FI3]|uniref:Uncharacterized protein n=2 Tax=Bipolaris TaxID=33194 RepID=W6YP61_COCC2|nr:uncharacterized protein COCCADRAFT_80737 [Bipolaris zeicola 26-R-13]XP_014561794.1 hypothetical protein COCVIDRAFT_86011 [Bipolaris victoriae FI3]EUC39313.1 hypothetical protein COCCADRAFT_80737 [Bipolaris zeicola 26-R-13]
MYHYIPQHPPRDFVLERIRKFDFFLDSVPRCKYSPTGRTVSTPALPLCTIPWSWHTYLISISHATEIF